MDDSVGSKQHNMLGNHEANASYVTSSTIGITNNNLNNNKLKHEINYKHLINFNQLAEKLRKIQKTNHSCGSPSLKSKKSHESAQCHESKKHLIYPRSISTFDNNRNSMKQKVNKKYSYNSIDRQQVQYSSSRNLNSEAHSTNAASFYTTQQQQQSIETNKTNSKKYKSEVPLHSSPSSSSLSSFESESFEMSCSNSSSRSSSINSFYGEKKSNNYSKSIISCNNTNNSITNNSNLKSKKQGKSISNVDAVNATPAAKQIVIRREKSVGYMQSQVPLSCTNNINKPIQISSSSFNTLYYNTNNLSLPNEELTSTPRIARSKPVKNGKNSSSSSHNEDLKSKQSKIINTSSTTSGIESNSKNSNYDNEVTNKETKSDIIDTNATNSISSSFELNELKNRLFMVEADLNNERKKLSHEKDLKKYLQYELKSRYEAEKAAALKALEAKLNAEKLYELNKLKESIEQQKRDEFDAKQKVLENQILSLKLKLREKSDKYSNLDKLLKEEQTKNNQLFSKSIEMVHKYQEIKNKKETNQQQANDLSNEIIKKRLLQIYMTLNNQSFPLNNFDLNQLLTQIESMIKYITKSLSDTQLEASTLHDQLEKVSNEYTNCKEQKLKLEALYKVKCKSDLNKSAQIKKCQLNCDLELMKFRNDYNYDLVRHLEAQLSIKDAEVLDLNAKLDKISNLVSNYSNFEPTNLTSKEIIKSLNGIINLTANEAFKKVPLNVLFTKETDSSNKQFLKRIESSSSKNEIDKVCTEKNKQLQEEMIKLDRQLNEMKSLKIKLAREKQDLLESNKDSLLKPKVNVRRDQEISVDSTFSTQHET